MKKIIILLILLVILALNFNCAYDLYYEGNWYDVEVPEDVISAANCFTETNDKIERINRWINENFKQVDFKQTRDLNVVIKSKKADCCEKGLMLLAFSYQITGQIGIYKNYNTTNCSDHFVPKINKIEYNTKLKKGEITTVNFEYNFKDIQNYYFSLNY